MTSSRPSARDWVLSTTLLIATLASTLYVGAHWAGKPVRQLSDLRHGLSFGLALMTILTAHEFGHFIAGRIHRIHVSPPYFLPAPMFLFGTLGAVIRIRETIRSRNALLDIGAAGPLAGLVVAIPVLVAGLIQSPVEALPSAGSSGLVLVEGKSLLYAGIRYALKGPLPPNADVMLSPLALAGWVGLLVTMINLLPVGQLDGGHIAYALFGARQNAISRVVRRSLPVLAIAIGGYHVAHAWKQSGALQPALQHGTRGLHWLVWWVVLQILPRADGLEHPPTDDSLRRPDEARESLSPARKAIAWLCMGLFVLLFMPTWLHQA
jgi:membrane-associated protease RseP (regulator of RpoE activity)